MMQFVKKVVVAILHFFFPPDPVEVAYQEASEKYRLYESSSKPEDLERAIAAFDTALTLCRHGPDTAGLLALILVNYATTLWARYKLDPEGSTKLRYDHLQEIITLDEEAHALWKTDHPPGDAYPTLLTNLANAYFDRAALGSPAAAGTYDECLELNREVLADQACSPAVRATAAFGVGRALWAGFDRRAPRAAAIAQLDAACDNLEAALAHAKAHGDAPTAATCLYCLVQAYEARGALSEQDADLASVIEYAREARGVLGAGSAYRASCLYILAAGLVRKYDREKDRADLDEAKAVALEGRIGDQAQDLVLQGKFGEMLDLIGAREERLPARETLL